MVANFFHWDIENCNSCIDMDGSIWIEFCDYEDFKRLLQLALRNNILTNDEQETLWDFIEKSECIISFW